MQDSSMQWALCAEIALSRVYSMRCAESLACVPEQASEQGPCHDGAESQGGSPLLMVDQTHGWMCALQLAQSTVEQLSDGRMELSLLACVLALAGAACTQGSLCVKPPAEKAQSRRH
jgi:hypothetical protein